MSKEKQRDEAGQFGGVYGSKNKAVREKATRDLWKKLGIKMPSSGRMISDQDLQVIIKAAKSKDGFFTSVSDLMDSIKKKNYTEKQKNKRSKRESDFLKELQKLREFQTGKSTKERASGRMIEQIIKKMGPMGTTKKILKKKKGGSKIRKNYAKGGGVRPTSY